MTRGIGLLCHFGLGGSLSCSCWSRSACDRSPHKVNWLDWAGHTTGVELTGFLAQSTVANIWNCGGEAISTGSLAFQKVWLDWETICLTNVGSCRPMHQTTGTDARVQEVFQAMAHHVTSMYLFCAVSIKHTREATANDACIYTRSRATALV